MPPCEGERLLLENPEPHSFRSPPTLTNDFSDRIRGSLETDIEKRHFRAHGPHPRAASLRR